MKPHPSGWGFPLLHISNFSLSAWADSQCVTHCIRRMAAPRRSTPHCCANLALHKNLYAAFAARASKVYRAPKPSLGGRGTAASAVVDEGHFLTFTAFCWSFLRFSLIRQPFGLPPSPREKVCGFAANCTININLTIYIHEKTAHLSMSGFEHKIKRDV